MFNPNQKRLLALDGGGILGVISLMILKKIETDLRPLSGKGADFRLSDVFDYIGGTSTGGIIAAGLALGKSVDEIIAFYQECGPAMFARASPLRLLHHRYKADALTRKLKEVMSEKSLAQLIDAGRLRTHLMIVTRNVTTDSPWPITTNPKAKYNDRARPDCNLQIPLWRLVRASTAAPTFFEPEVVVWDDEDPDGRTFLFEDGGITPYNNPAFLLYRKATLPEYRMDWPTGEDKLMLVSIGTGSAFRLQAKAKLKGEMILSRAASLPSELMKGVAVENDIHCRTTGRCVFGAEIDREIGAMLQPTDGPPPSDGPRKFLYARYDPDVSEKGLAKLGLSEIVPRSLGMDNFRAISDMMRIGEAYARKEADIRRHFAPFMPASADLAAPAH